MKQTNYILQEEEKLIENSTRVRLVTKWFDLKHFLSFCLSFNHICMFGYSFIPYFVCMLFHLFRSFVFCFFCSFFCSFVALFVLSFPPSFCLCFCLYQLTIISSFLVVLLSFFLHVFISLSLCLSVCLSSVCLSFSVFLYQSINVFRLLIFWFFVPTTWMERVFFGRWLHLRGLAIIHGPSALLSIQEDLFRERDRERERERERELESERER